MWTYFVDDFNVSYVQQNFFFSGTFQDLQDATKLYEQKQNKF